MSIIVALTIVIAAWKGGMAIARLAIDLIATAMSVMLALRAARIRRHIIAMREERGEIDFDRRLSRPERRAMAVGLKLAIRQTELRSLFPVTMERAERIAAACGD